MRVRRVVAVVVSVAALSGFTAVAVPAAVASAHPATGTAYPQAWCSNPKAPPCVVAVSQDGNAILSSDTTWVASAGPDFSTNGDHQVQWSINNENVPGSYASMGSDQTTHLWSITLKLDTDPRSISGYLDQMQTSVVDNGDGTWNVTMSGYPVTTGVNDECTATTPESCPFKAGEDVTLFQGQADDFEFSNIPVSQQNDYNGIREWTNVEESDLPPQVSGNPLQITEQLTNSHELSTGAVFQGFFHAILPNPFLVDMGIDDPSTIDPASISTSIGSGTVSVVPGAGSTEVDITGISFTHRVLHIKRGTITPTRPKITKAKRGAHSAKLSFSKAKPRGSHLHSYQARCTATHYSTRTASGKRSPLVVKHLIAGVAYKCQVRAKAKAGYGSWSKKHKIKG